MQIHNIKRKTANKKVMLVGRGGKRGKTSGRGGKGQTARAGHKARPEWRDFIKRMPKLRGYSFQSISGVKNPVTAINLDLIEKNFKDVFQRSAFLSECVPFDLEDRNEYQIID